VGDKSLRPIKATPPLLVNDLTRYSQPRHRPHTMISFALRSTDVAAIKP